MLKKEINKGLVSDLVFIRYTHVRKYLKPSWVDLAKGPQTSQWIRSKVVLDKWLKKGNGKRFCFAMGQRVQFLLLWIVFTFGIKSWKAWSLAFEACPSLKCQRYGLVMIGTSETLLTKVPKTESRMEDVAESDLQEVVDSKYRLLCSLPTPIVFQQERFYIKHKLDKKTKQQDSLFFNWLTEIKLKVKAQTLNTFSRTRLAVTWIVPMCVTTTLSPLGNWTKDEMELVILMNNLTEWTIWSVAPVLRT